MAGIAQALELVVPGAGRAALCHQVDDRHRATGAATRAISAPGGRDVVDVMQCEAADDDVELL